MKKNITIMTIGIFALIVLQTQAALIEIAITAEVTDVDDPGSLLEGNVNVGDTITGSYKYDSDTPDSSPIDPVVGFYWHYSAPHGITLNVGSLIFQSNPADVEFLINIINDSTSGGELHDSYGLRSYRNISNVNLHVDSISWWLRDNTATNISSDALLNTPPIVNDWGDLNSLVIAGGKEGGYGIGAIVTSAVLVPEPSSFLILSFGFLYLRKRK